MCDKFIIGVKIVSNGGFLEHFDGMVVIIDLVSTLF